MEEPIRKLGKRKFQIIKRTVSSAGQIISINESVLEHLEEVKGVYTSYSDGTAKPGATLKLSISNQEIFPEEFESDMISPKDGVSINDVAWEIAEKGSGSSIDGRYTDASASDGFEAYEVRIYLICLDTKR